MSITGKPKVSAGEFELAMIKVENPGGICGEQGTIKFTPNAKAKDTNSLRLLQVVKTTTGGPSAPDYTWGGGEARRNSMMTKEDHSGTLMGAAAGAVLGGAVGGAAGAIVGGIAGGLMGSKNDVAGGYFVDHQAATSTPRTSATDAPVSPFYRDHWANPGSSQDGFKRGTSIQHASLWDFPQDTNDGSFLFETAAKGADNGVTYGTVKWQFTIQASKVVNESWSVDDNTSATFDAAVDAFNDAYHNPGSPSAPAAAPPTPTGGSKTP